MWRLHGHRDNTHHYHNNGYHAIITPQSFLVHFRRTLRNNTTQSTFSANYTTYKLIQMFKSWGLWCNASFEDYFYIKLMIKIKIELLNNLQRPKDCLTKTFLQDSVSYAMKGGDNRLTRSPWGPQHVGTCWLPQLP